jgi:SAM-dependent methyltransferase
MLVHGPRNFRLETLPGIIETAAMTRTFARKLKDATPAPVARLVPRRLKDWMLGTQSGFPPLSSYASFNDLMKGYQTKDLVNTDPLTFRRTIESYLDLSDAKMEGYADAAKQRDLSIRFQWGHDHDFGDFFVPGKLGDRHVSLIAGLVEWLQVLPRSLDGKSVMDIGCWSGGTTLLLKAMGADVVGIEEVKKYADCLDYLGRSFALDGFEAESRSLYDCTDERFQNRFDYILFAGVLYHVTDPVLALRIVFNCLKDGGVCILETAVTPSDELVLAYEGPTVIFSGSVDELTRTGWNWYLPSPSTLERMMADVGFTDIRLTKVIESSAGPRILAVGTRGRHTDMLRAGLSVRTIR